MFAKSYRLLFGINFVEHDFFGLRLVRLAKFESLIKTVIIF